MTVLTLWLIIQLNHNIINQYYQINTIHKIEHVFQIIHHLIYWIKIKISFIKIQIYWIFIYYHNIWIWNHSTCLLGCRYFSTKKTVFTIIFNKKNCFCDNFQQKQLCTINQMDGNMWYIICVSVGMDVLFCDHQCIGFNWCNLAMYIESHIFTILFCCQYIQTFLMKIQVVTRQFPACKKKAYFGFTVELSGSVWKTHHLWWSKDSKVIKLVLHTQNWWFKAGIQVQTSQEWS